MFRVKIIVLIYRRNCEHVHGRASTVLKGEIATLTVGTVIAPEVGAFKTESMPISWRKRMRA